jgi:alanine racemase
MNYTLSEIARITGGKLIGEERPVGGVSIDSRTGGDLSDSLFVALAGKNRDGHDYLSPMYDRGIRAFLVNRPPTSPTSPTYPGAGFVVVGDTLSALQRWAAHHRDRFKGTVVGITGSNGKTIVKEWIAQLTPPGTKLFRSPRSYNSQIGVPLSLLMIRGDEQVAVIEAGISRPGEMERLEAMIRPDITVLTHIGDAHQENFSSIEQKRAEKEILARRSSRLIVSERDEALDRRIRQYLPFADPISLENARLAVVLWEALGEKREDILPQLAHLQPVAMRMELREGIGGSKILNDSYNADINSLSAALDALHAMAPEQEKALILSDIFQAGMDDKALYGEVSRLAEKAGVGLLIGIGERISACADLFHMPKRFYSCTRSFIENIDRTLFTGKAILIKGSRVFEFEKISRLLDKQVHTTVLQVDLDAMIRNLNRYRAKLSPKTKVMAMVKALGYGSGGFEVAAALQRQGVEVLAVAFADEGIALREAGITMPVVVLNADSGSFQQMIEYDLEPEIYNFASLDEFSTAVLQSAGRWNYPIHLSFDTGMHRLGFTEEELPVLIERLMGQQEVCVRSAFTHFAASDEEKHDAFTRAQLEQLLRIGRGLRAAFPEREIMLHAANSAGIERFPGARELDWVRLGIGLYGISDHEPGLEAVGTLKSRIVQIKHLPPGETVGYGRHGQITRSATIATIPIGYADGLDRRLGRGKWSFEVNGKPAPTVGNICMDTCMIDITGIEAVEGDEVVIFGGSEGIKRMAEVLETIPYEILTSVSARVKRVFLKE